MCASFFLSSPNLATYPLRPCSPLHASPTLLNQSFIQFHSLSLLKVTTTQERKPTFWISPSLPEMPTLTKLYSLQEASEHKAKNDCWVIVDGKVYDVTDYLDEHPGGDDVLIEAAGRDATQDFEDAGHSKSAIELMKDYCIGELEPSPIIPELEIVNKQQTGFAQKFMDMTSQYWAIPAAIVGISVVVGMLYLRKK